MPHNTPKHTTICTVLLFCANILAAQTQYSSEWSFHAGGGSTMYKFSSETFEKETPQSGIGGAMGINYAYFFAPYIGFSLGIEAAMYNNSLQSSLTLNTEQQIETPMGLQGKFYLRTQYENITENHTAILLQLPLLLRLQLPISSKNYFYLSAGGKYGQPLTANYMRTYGTQTTTGYSDDTKLTYSNMPNHGLETKHNIPESDNLNLKATFIPTIETGIKWQNRKGNALYTGAYIDINHAIGIKLAFSLGIGTKMEPPEKPLPLFGN
ncbi:hypothetical protein FACS1894199_14290 [Bacteroidia bacterium]|nr:hypothetical protein FACS1894199_14290 [Bacteroidia bacterium]